MAKLRHTNAGAVRAITTGGKRILEVLAAPFGSPTNLDRLEQYFSVRTDFMLEVGDKRPTLYMHGFSPLVRKMEQPISLGVAEVTRVDKDGVWMQTELDDSELSTRTWNAALEGKAKASTGSVNYLERHNDATGEVLCWPIAELSVFDAGDKRVPVSDNAVVLPLRALFTEHGIDLPDTFEAGEDKEDKSESKRGLTKLKNTGVTKMDEKELKALIAKSIADDKALAVATQEAEDAMRTKILDEMKEDPKYRATFNVSKNTSKGALRLSEQDEKDGITLADKEQEEAFVWNLMNPTQAPKAMRVLEESEAAEGASLIPTPLLNKIIALKDETSLVSKLGITKYQTDSLTLEVPREDSGMGVFATIAEESAYVANEPAFSGTTCTVVKKGSMITVTEDMLDDSKLFVPYFTKLCARKWALTENLELFTKLKATATVGLHSATFTQPEIDEWMYKMTEPWNDNAHIIMAQATMGTIRGLLIATPRAYGDFAINDGLHKNPFFGFPVHLNSNWEAVGAGDTTLTMTMVNPDALAYVERAGLSIKVDPYGDALNGRVRYFPRYRAVCEVIQVLGNVDYTDHA